MGVDPIGKLLFKISFPIMVSMLIQSLYNIVDSHFVSLINEEAFTAVSMAFPIQNLMTGLAIGTGVGMNSLISRSLGERNFSKVNLAAESGVLLSIFHALIFVVIGLVFPRMYFATQTDNTIIINYGVEYLTACTVLSIGIFMQITMERLLQSTGLSMYSMITQILGAILNIILDPILIFGLYGAPKMGVTGAAIATVIGQCSAAALGLFFNLKYNKEIKIQKFKLDFKTVKQIYAVGIPSFALMATGSLAVYLLNKILLGFSTTAVAALGVYYKIQNFVFMPVFGLNNGMIPIIAYNYGARNVDRTKQTIFLSFKIATAVMVVGLLIFQIFPNQLLMIFNASDHLLEIGSTALRIVSISFIMAGIVVICQAVFQALGNGVLSLISTIIRQILVLVPGVYILSFFGNLDLVWIAYPIAEVASLVYCLYYLKKFALRKIETNR
ncbi:MATE family efflux transporter [Anaerosphaera multitolerans]|uniref:Probable multidrug resistance protein NorM n=2 Tax=Anaerosphaera multitolerans TaxID=2487351 RepID=A0A437S4G1_9FIRM|nr:MATE family efflux transporter [Anaerosphaera multitolerans]